MHSVANDPQFRTEAQRDAINGSVQAHLSARRTHKTTCACTLCKYAGCSEARPCDHCLRDHLASFAPSLEALCDKYPQVRELVAERDRLRRRVGDLVETLSEMEKGGGV